ncbi:hypothetical protein L228DRAFT_260795 [Xylona heveae TC161]|uniref:Uncharacterized protein n=1 Tax=Xylona heveae (strain CBS 132557 / TC161) TaxID=1328760 RepID=A0A165GV81_XYLHT|nr:hypothetical protein L228DRAFT_260795 [Xylona heveae TC161]KZF22637.1 hypothetical protein L228DRAFT_260795 [Xylona heveae TC161]
MERQRRSVRQKPLTTTDAMKRLVGKAKKVAVLGCLSKIEKRRAADAIAISQTAPKTRKRQKYKLFLCDLLENSGPHSFLLCAIALGQAIIANMKQQDRSRLVDLIKNDTRLSQPNIRDLAIQNHIPVSLDMLNISGIQNTNNAIRLQGKTAVPETYEEQTMQVASQSMSNNEISMGRQIELMWSKAPVGLIPQLGDVMQQAIESSLQWKMERAAGDETTDCFVTIVPEDKNADMSINLRVGQRFGLQLLNLLKLRPMWSSLLGHLPP